MQDLERQLAEERRVAELAREFLALEQTDIEAGIERGLGEAGHIAGVDRCYLVAVPGSQGRDADRYEWVDAGVASRRPHYEGDTTLGQFQWVSDRLRRGEAVKLARLDDLPPEAAAEHEVLGRHGVRSCLFFPLRSGAATMGVLGFECHRQERDWTQRQIAILELVVEVFASVLRRKRDEDARVESQRALQRQLALAKQLADLSRHLVGFRPEQLAAGIREKLPELAGLARADHIALTSFEPRSLKAEEVYEWWQEGVPAESRRGAPRHGDFPYATEILGQGRVYHVPSVAGLPAEAIAERVDLEVRGVRSQLTIPFFSTRRFSGLLTVECLSREHTWFEEDITLLRLAGEILAGALFRMHAAEELLESQTLLLQSQKMEAVGTLAGGIAHDFNNQLAVMLGNARFVLEGLKDQPDIASALGDIERAAEHCARLTEGLLAFSRRQPVEDRPLEVARLLHEVQGLVSPLLPASIHLKLLVSETVDWIRADAIQLQQVLINLIVNARDAMPEGGNITLCSRRRQVGHQEAAGLALPEAGLFIDLMVADDGLGMSPEVARRVFEPFFTTKEVGAGTGLGLATAYGIVQQSRGRISVESELGCGATFHVLLPSAPPERAAAPRASVVDELEARGRVLLVEDEPAVRRVVQRMLSDMGFFVIEAQDGATGLRIGRERLATLDLLITDLTMPHASGIELARGLLIERPDLPVLFLSGHSDGRVERVSGELERAGFLQKPFDVSDLTAALRMLIQSDSP
ncbi:MAG: response regulator [Deltaproteobacteria bacterium]|nr:response regulator [Deltaproteobacteria bacterium]